MITRIVTATLASAMLLGALPTFAQAPDSNAAPQTDSSATKPAPMTCQQMMDKAKPMVSQMTDQAMMAKAQKHMDHAQKDMDSGKMGACKKQMHMVMHMMK